MPDVDIHTAARVLASHALVLLALGLVLAGLALAAVVAVVRLAARQRDGALTLVSRAVAWADERPVLRTAIGRTRMFVPSAYVAFHLGIGLVLVGAITVFASVAEQTVVEHEELATFDMVFAETLHARTSERGLAVFTAVSWLGSREVLTGITVIVAAVLVRQRRRLLAIGWVTAQAGGALLNVALKEGFQRARPAFADPVLAASSWSFPSGHAMGTFIAFGVLGYLIVRQRRSWQAAVAVVAIVLGWCLLVAFSRLYLGVHYVSDVMAGLVGGVAWVAVCVSAFEVAQRRGRRRGS